MTYLTDMWPSPRYQLNRVYLGAVAVMHRYLDQVPAPHTAQNAVLAHTAPSEAAWRTISTPPHLTHSHYVGCMKVHVIPLLNVSKHIYTCLDIKIVQQQLTYMYTIVYMNITTGAAIILLNQW